MLNLSNARLHNRGKGYVYRRCLNCCYKHDIFMKYAVASRTIDNRGACTGGTTCLDEVVITRQQGGLCQVHEDVRANRRQKNNQRTFEKLVPDPQALARACQAPISPVIAENSPTIR